MRGRPDDWAALYHFWGSTSSTVERPRVRHAEGVRKKLLDATIFRSGIEVAASLFDDLPLGTTARRYSCCNSCFASATSLKLCPEFNRPAKVLRASSLAPVLASATAR
jgi:hypothetical protein